MQVGCCRIIMRWLCESPDLEMMNNEKVIQWDGYAIDI